MDPEQLDEHRRALLSLRARLLTAGSVVAEPVRRDAVTAADEDEQPLAEMGQSIASRQNQTRAATLLQIAAALEKIEHRPDEYGLCELCEEEIAPARLRALPHASGWSTSLGPRTVGRSLHASVSSHDLGSVTVLLSAPPHRRPLRLQHGARAHRRGEGVETPRQQDDAWRAGGYSCAMSRKYGSATPSSQPSSFQPASPRAKSR